jgi:hypothetical protein
MLKLKTNIATYQSVEQLKQRVQQIIKRHPFVLCKALNNRKVFTNKWINVNLTGKRGTKRRLQSFSAGLDLINATQTAIQNSNNEWELIGETPCGNIIKVHIREEKHKNDRLLFYISSFHKKNPALRD